MKAVRSVAVCAIFMSIWIGSTSEAVEHGPKGRSVRDFVKKFSVDDRSKRAATVVGALLKTARIVHSSEWFRLYVKPGGHKQAMKDFKSLKPKRVDDFGSTSWAEIGSGVTERQVRVEKLLGQTTLTIWRKAKGKGGNAELSIDKIEYF